MTQRNQRKNPNSGDSAGLPAAACFRSLSGKLPEILEAGLSLSKEIVAGEGALPPRSDADRFDENSGLRLQDQGREFEQVLEALRQVVLGTPSSASPRFFNQLFGGREPVATLAEILTTLTNTSMYTYKVAGPQILIEREVLARMASKVGFGDGEGIFVPGGSMANMVAMVIARNEAVEGLREHGVGAATMVAYTSDHGHYSTRKNAGLTGIGRGNLKEVATNSAGRMDVKHLRRLIRQDRAAGRLPFFINATAGTTVLGAFDPIRKIADVASDEGIWLHVDGALGGSVLLSERHRDLLVGSECADSFSWNAHKMMGVPLSCSVVLLKEKGLLSKSFNESASYLFQADEDELNPGTRSLQCGRRNDALKLWAAWLYHGDEGYGARVDRLFDLAGYAVSQIDDDPDLVLTTVPQSINVCFEVRGRSTAAICECLDAEARLKISHGVVFGRRIIRLVCINPDLDEADIDRVFEEIKTVAKGLPVGDNAVK